MRKSLVFPSGVGKATTILDRAPGSNKGLICNAADRSSFFNAAWVVVRVWLVASLKIQLLTVVLLCATIDKDNTATVKKGLFMNNPGQ